MVARNSDSARGVNERLKDISKKHEELVRSVGRGPSALRSASDNVLEMDDEAAVPILKSTEQDIGVAFNNTGDYGSSQLEVVDGTGGNFKNVKANGFISTNDVIAGRHIRAAGELRIQLGIRSEFAVSSAGDIVADAAIRGNVGLFNAEIRVGPRPVTVNGNFIAAPGCNITTDPNGSMNSLHFYGGTFHGVLASSERRLKVEKNRITNGLAVIEKLIPARWHWNMDIPRSDYDTRDNRLHAGIYVDELREVAPEATHYVQKPGDDGVTPVDGDELTYEDRAVIAYLVSAVQQLNDVKNANEQRMVKMQTEIDDLKETVNRLINPTN